MNAAVLIRTGLATFGLASLAMAANAAPSPNPAGIYDFEVKPINGAGEGKPMKLSAYRGKVVLIVNTASECGFTKQYKGLQALYEKLRKDGKDDFVILGFPSNDFGAQEPDSNEKIKHFCERNFKVSFPLFEKAPVSGNRIQPLYAYLVANAPWKGAVGWNFEKFLVSRDGKIVERFKSSVTPEDPKLTDAIDANLKRKI